MIGASAFFVDLMFVVVPTTFVLAALAAVRRPDTRIAGLLILAFGALMLSIGSVRLWTQYQTHRLLGELGVVESISVDGKAVPEEHLESVLAALRETRWFANNHGGWGREVPLRVKSSARELGGRVALYYRAEGAVLQLSQRRGEAEFHYGYVFFPKLPAALREAGVPLPGDGDIP